MNDRPPTHTGFYAFFERIFTQKGEGFAMPVIHMVYKNETDEPAYVKIDGNRAPVINMIGAWYYVPAIRDKVIPDAIRRSRHTYLVNKTRRKKRQSNKQIKLS